MTFANLRQINTRGILDVSRIQQYALVRFIIFLLVESDQ